MVAKPVSWGRLRGLLARRTWDRREAALVVAGLDPATDWLDEEEPLVWLPAGQPPEWRTLGHEQVQRRAERAVMVAETKLLRLPIPVMPPEHWLYEAMVRKQVQPHWADSPYLHPGILPPWLSEARKQPGFELLVPPSLYPQADRARQGHAGQPLAKQRAIIRRMWDAWSLDGEGSYPSKAAFIEEVARVLDGRTSTPNVNLGSIRNLIDEWERELFCPYGIIGRGDAVPIRGYGPHAIMGPAKRTGSRHTSK